VPVPEHCPKCSSTAIKYFGIGTQKVEAFFRKEFPQIKYARLDTDLTRKKGYLEEVLGKMKRKEIQVLIGTQMISKGLDFEDVTLIGVLNPDSLVRMGDYSASERAFQLFVQIAGRSGRKDKKGEVLLQTYTPNREIYRRVLDYDLPGFLKEELQIRKTLNFPPYACLIHIQSSSKDPGKAQDTLEKFYQEIRSGLSREMYLELHEPQKSPIEKIEGRFRYRCILKAKESPELWEKLLEIRRNFRTPRNSRLKILVDADNLL
jgi:primosomal protein N' (replication factor Y)